MLHSFQEIWCVDFEFESPDSGNPRPICMVALELKSGREIRLFRDELLTRPTAPYSTSADSLFVAYLASAELGCHLALGWPFPENVLDLYVEFRNLANGTAPTLGFGLLGALHYFGLDPMRAIEKDAMRDLAMRGGPWTTTERQALLDYCRGDSGSLAALLTRMEPKIDLPRALLRGRYMKAVARMEHAGIPLDTAVLERLQHEWASLQADLVAEVDATYGVYEGLHFCEDRFRRWLDLERIVWPVLESGHLALDKSTFKRMGTRFPQVEQLRQLRDVLAQLRKLRLKVGPDQRSRSMLSPFCSKTSRNQPSTTKFIFGLSAWSRNMIRPAPGQALAYVDWRQQEFGIAARLSKDEEMIGAYRSGDPYLAFAKQAGAVPQDATEKTHPQVREQFKQCSLAVQYCMGAESLAERLGVPLTKARALLLLHRKTYRKFWNWSDAAVDYANLHGEIHSAFGWHMRVTKETGERTLRNYPMQANGAEMLRLACCLLTEQGIRVCAPVHDALLVEAPVEEIQSAKETTQQAMAEASSFVLDGFPLRTESKIIVYPDRFQDQRGQKMWDLLMSHLGPKQIGCMPSEDFIDASGGQSCERPALMRSSND
jgi:DNA polymerase-1